MANFTFERDCRTTYSEAYSIFEDDRPVGRIDLHFTSTVVHGTLSVVDALTEENIHELIETVDDDIVMTADAPRQDFIVTVYQGRNLGTFSDEDFEEETEENGDGHHN